MQRNNRKRRKRLTPPTKPLVLELPESSPWKVPLSNIRPDVILDLMRTSARARPQSGHLPHVAMLLSWAMMKCGVPPGDALATVHLPSESAKAEYKMLLAKRDVTDFELLVRLWAALLDQNEDKQILIASRVIWEDVQARSEEYFPHVNDGVLDVIRFVTFVVPLLLSPLDCEVFFETYPNTPLTGRLTFGSSMDCGLTRTSWVASSANRRKSTRRISRDPSHSAFNSAAPTPACIWISISK